MEDEAKRKSISISLSPEVRDFLNELKDNLVLEDGRPYPMSYIVEDMIIWIISDEDRYEQFLNDNYAEEDEEDEKEENKSPEE